MKTTPDKDVRDAKYEIKAETLEAIIAKQNELIDAWSAYGTQVAIMWNKDIDDDESKDLKLRLWENVKKVKSELSALKEQEKPIKNEDMESNKFYKDGWKDKDLLRVQSGFVINLVINRKMKITRVYLGGCTWCNATGFIQPIQGQITSTAWSNVCPVCKGAKTIPITETFESDIVTANDNTCDLCGQKMKAQNKEFVEYECMNPKCDAYCKIRPVKKLNYPLTDIDRG